MEKELKKKLLIGGIVIAKNVRNNWDESVSRSLNKLWEI